MKRRQHHLNDHVHYSHPLHTRPLRPSLLSTKTEPFGKISTCLIRDLFTTKQASAGNCGVTVLFISVFLLAQTKRGPFRYRENVKRRRQNWRFVSVGELTWLAVFISRVANSS